MLPCPFSLLSYCHVVLLTTISVIIGLMKEGRVRIRTYLPQKVYVELHKRYMYDHLPFLLALFLEEFLETGVSISWEEMPTKAEQKQYLEQKLREFLSGTIKGRPPQESSSKKAKENSLREAVPSLSEANREEVKTEKEKEEEKKTEEEELWDSEERRKAEFLKRFEQFW